MICLHSGIQDLELCLTCSRPRYKVTARKITEITEAAEVERRETAKAALLGPHSAEGSRGSTD